MKILSIEFTPNWSWGLIFTEISKRLNVEFERTFINKGNIINTSGVDMVFAQNVTLLKKFQERLRTVCRMGGNYNFDGAGKLEPLLHEMAKCYCIVATNKKLYEIAKAVNENVYLIPNGLDLDEWKPISDNVKRPFTVGFCGNIITPQYREYKGYDLVERACGNARVKLQTALYQDKQIPHDKMRELFYSQIDCIVHPTLGEGCSNTLMEAAACGIPIITTEVAGFHGELMKHGEDVLFCNRTINSIQKAVMLLRKDKKLRKKLALGARAFAEKHHDINTIAKQYEIIFSECVKKSKTVSPAVRFFSITSTPQKTTAMFAVNGGKPQSRQYPAGYAKDKMRETIINEYLTARAG